MTSGLCKWQKMQDARRTFYRQALAPSPSPHINRPQRIKEGCTFFPIPSHLALNDKMKSVYKRGAEQKPDNPNDLRNQISPEM